MGLRAGREPWNAWPLAREGVRSDTPSARESDVTSSDSGLASGVLNTMQPVGVTVLATVASSHANRERLGYR